MHSLISIHARLAGVVLLSVLLSGCLAEGGYMIGGPRATGPRDGTSTGSYPSTGRPSGDQGEWSDEGGASRSGGAGGSDGAYGSQDPYSGSSVEGQAYRIPSSDQRPLTASQALGQGDAAREASMRLVISGLDEDAGGVPSRALANYQRAVRLDSTNPFAYLALCRHHLEYGSPEEASAFLDQARAGFEAEGRLGPGVDVWGLGLRAWVDRARGQDDSANRRFRQAQALAPNIWADELLSAGELR